MANYPWSALCSTALHLFLPTRMDLADVIVKLLTEGMFSEEYHGTIESLNELLRPIGYEVVQWPDKSCIVLKDIHETHAPDTKAKEAEDAFTRIVLGMPVSEGILDMLIRDKWVEHIDGVLQLTKRALVQHTDFISALNGKYKHCSVCGFLNYGNDLHHFCKSLLEEKH